MRVREIEKILLKDNWYFVKQVGSHRQYKHPTKPGKVTIPIHTGDLDKYTVKQSSNRLGFKKPSCLELRRHKFEKKKF